MHEATNNTTEQQYRSGTDPAKDGIVGSTATEARTMAQERRENASEAPAGVTGRENAPERTTGGEPAGERKRVDPIAAAEAKLQKREASLAEKRNLLTQRKRKARNGQLYVWGAMVEAAYRHGDAGQRAMLRGLADTYLTDERHRECSGFGFSRVDDERAESKI